MIIYLQPIYNVVIEMFMNRFILFSAILLTPNSLYAESAKTDKNGFITHNHAVHCIKLSENVTSSQQLLVNFESRKANLKSKIDYLHNQIQIRRVKIEELDQRNDQQNSKNYNQLINQFENLIEERKQVVAQYNLQNQNHLTHHQENIDLQNNYTKQCLNHIQVNQKLHKQLCTQLTNPWCSGFTF